MAIIYTKIAINKVTEKVELFTPRPNQLNQIYCFLEELEKLEVNLFL